MSERNGGGSADEEYGEDVLDEEADQLPTSSNQEVEDEAEDDGDEIRDKDGDDMVHQPGGGS
jgi:hypothetical protein